MKNVYDLPKEKCTGCGACKNICPTGAIDLKYDIDGFLYPIINQEKCINCGKCYKFCPAENYNFTNKEQTECYAVMAKDDVRLKSSSGGVFGFLANYVLDNNGIVCGTKYTNNYDAVEHILISDKKEVESLYKAKYVQSDTKDCFKRIKEYLEENKLVLFCGCPCQVAGLKMFLKNEYANLITCDILCHGVGSNLAYKKYLQDISNGKAITKVDFRPKEKNGWGNYTQINFDDGTEYYKNWTKDSWYLGFLKGITVRKSCGSCKYARRTRVGDFTIGDFWGIDRQNKDFNDNNGTSLVIVNNKKAIEILNSIKKDLKLCEKANLQMASENNNVLNRPDGLHPYRTEFFEKLHRLSYTQAFSYIYNKYDVGIIGFWNGNNYGSSFTYFALAKTIQSLGYRVCFIEEPYCLVNNVNRSTVPYKFFYKYFNLKTNNNFYSLENLNELCDIFILGSDQVFAYPCIKARLGYYLLNFVDDNKKKIAYASSFGHGKLLNPPNKLDVFKMSLKRFDNISVREQSGVELCKQLGITADWVLDPVFLCPKAEYEKLASKSTKNITEPYILAYILDPTPEKREAILYAQKKLGISAKVLLTGMDNFEIQKKLMDLNNNLILIDEIEDFFYYYKNCSFVITDSYHGTCASIIFEKNFISIENPKRGTARTDTLKQMFGINSKVCSNPKEIITEESLFENINYKMLKEKLNTYRNKSFNWLKNALQSNQNRYEFEQWLNGNK